MSCENKVVVITGGAQGIGKEIGLIFAKNKASVVLLDINYDRLLKTQEELSQYTQVLIYEADVSSLANIETCFNKIIDKMARIDILINNAGITRDNLILRLSEEDWESVYRVNLKGVFNCSKVAARYMLKQREGVIINISSIIGIIGNPGQLNYAASKAAILGMTKTLAKELGSRNIRVNAVAPGYIKTAMTDKLSDKVKEDMLKRIPLSRFGEPQDVAKAVYFLASDDASYISGQVLVVDGGMV